MPKSELDLVKTKAKLAAERAEYFAGRCKERYDQLHELKVVSPGVDTAGEINLLLSVLSLWRATEVEYRAIEALSSKTAAGDLKEDLDKAKVAMTMADKQKEDAEELVDSGQMLDTVTTLIEDFLETPGTRNRIYERLEEFDQLAQDAVAQAERKGSGLGKTTSDMIFIAESLPIIQGIIHVATDRKSLGQAIKWIRETWGETANSLIILSALVFAYIAKRGASHTKGTAKHEAWMRIKERASKFSGIKTE
jgi:hypothetical protein